MGRVTRVANYLTLEEIDERIGQCNAAWGMKRWMAIRHAIVDPKPAKEIGMHVWLAKQTVNNLVSAYNLYGPEALETPGKGGRRRSYLSLEEEKAFVESFKERSKKGENRLAGGRQFHLRSADSICAWKQRLKSSRRLSCRRRWQP